MLIISLPSILSKLVLFPVDISQFFFFSFFFISYYSLFIFTNLCPFLVGITKEVVLPQFGSYFSLFIFLPNLKSYYYYLILLHLPYFFPILFTWLNLFSPFLHLVSISYTYYFSSPYHLKVTCLSISHLIFFFPFI